MNNLFLFWSVYLVSALAMVLYPKFILLLNDVDKYHRRYFLFGFIMAFPLSYLNINSTIIIKDLVMFIGIIIFLRYYNKIAISKLVVSYIFIWSIVIILDLLTAMLFKGNPLPLIINNPLLFKVLTTIFYMIVVYIIIKLMNKLNLKKIIRNNYSIIVSVLILSLLIIIGVLNYKTYNDNTTYLFFLLLFIGLVIILLFLWRTYRNITRIIKENDYLISRNQETITYINDFKIYKHNIKYKLTAIQEYGNKKVKKLIGELLDNNKKELSYVKSISNIPSIFISIIADRFANLGNYETNIEINNNLKEELHISNPKNYLIVCEAIGNILTNALEALPEKNGIIIINFFNRNDNNYIEVINNFNEQIDLDRLGKINYSTKNRDSGFGLFSVIDNQKLDIKVEIKENLFIIKIKIPK